MTIRSNLESRPKLSEIIGKGVLSRDDWTEAKKIISESEKITLEKLSKKV